ncbi:MAG: twin-arginine translocase TatA/TatE family subunit [Actinomycetota bacterium]|nr:twin-arginine translocase TatA/TatE family subunit [Actinomycetota bacterium]
MPSIGGFELIIVLLVILLLFGSTRLPKLAKSLGEAQKEFKKGVADADGPSTTTPPAEEKVTMTKAELDALLAEREAQARKDAPPSA